MKTFRLLSMVLLATFLAQPNYAQEDESVVETAKKLAKMLGNQETPFLRVVKGKTASRLETACVTYEDVDTGLKVTLISAVHIADKSYYKSLQKHLEQYDTVFFEGVERDKKASNVLSLVSRLQTALRDSLALSFQPEEMDMTKKNMVRADIKASELEGKLKEQGISLLPNQDLIELFGPFVEKGLRMLAPEKGKPESTLKKSIRRRLKTVFAEALSKGLGLYEKIKKPEDKARDALLIGTRNERAMKLLKERIVQKPDGKYAILYGGAHHPDFERRLKAELGLQKTNTSWLKAWDMSDKKDAKKTPTSKPADSGKKPKSRSTKDL